MCDEQAVISYVLVFIPIPGFSVYTFISDVRYCLSA